MRIGAKHFKGSRKTQRLKHHAQLLRGETGTCATSAQMGV